MFLFNRHRNIVTKEEYEGIKDEINKLKENIQVLSLQLQNFENILNKKMKKFKKYKIIQNNK